MTRIMRSGLAALALLAFAGGAAADEKVQIEAADGLTLNGYLVLAEGSRLQDGVVLVTHGSLAHGRMEIVTALQKALQERGVNSLAITLGLGVDDREGMMDCQAPQDHRHTEAMAEIDRWLDWLRGQGVQRVVLAGHSRGANQTAWYLADHDDPLVEKGILIAPIAWSAHETVEEYEQRYGAQLDTVFKAAKSLVESGRGDTLIDVPGFLHCERARVTAATFVDYYEPDERFDAPFLLLHIKRPVLVFTGSEDPNAGPELTDRLIPLAKDDRIEWTVIDGAGHFFRDLYMEDLADVAVEFIGWDGAE